jgi:DNA-binding transcriptional MerR regulator
MQTQSGGLRRIKAFATEAGVSVRTLHLYDRLGLLRPAAVSESGYRFYGDAELERLEHILALRFVGFSLDQITDCSRDRTCHWPRRCTCSARSSRDRSAGSNRCLPSSRKRSACLPNGASADRWTILRTVMEAFTMQNDWKWTQEYYSEAAREKIDGLGRGAPAEVIEQGQRDWTALIAKVEAAVANGVEPSSAQARALARRWRELIAQFTRGDAEISQGTATGMEPSMGIEPMLSSLPMTCFTTKLRRR